MPRGQLGCFVAEVAQASRIVPGIQCVLSQYLLSELASSNTDKCKITNVEELIGENEEIYLRAPPNSISSFLFFLETSPGSCSYPCGQDHSSLFLLSSRLPRAPASGRESMLKTQRVCSRALCHIPVSEGSR